MVWLSFGKATKTYNFFLLCVYFPTKKSSCNCANTVPRLPYTIHALKARGSQRCRMPVHAPHSAAAVPVHELCERLSFVRVLPSSLSRLFSPLRQPDLQRWHPSTSSFPSVSPNSPGPAWSTAAAVPHPLGAVTDP